MQKWTRARADYKAARLALIDAEDAFEGTTPKDAPEGDDTHLLALADVVDDTLETWLSMTPPNWQCFTEALGESIKRNICDRNIHHQECPLTMRDLLDAQDEGSVAARFYLHALRLIGSDSPAGLTPPMVGLFPQFWPADCLNQKERVVDAWERHHATAPINPNRVAEFAAWDSGLSALGNGFGYVAKFRHAEARRMVRDANIIAREQREAPDNTGGEQAEAAVIKTPENTPKALAIIAPGVDIC